MIKLKLGARVVSWLFCAVAALADEVPVWILEVQTDRTGSVYQVNEAVRFQIRLRQDGAAVADQPLRYRLTQDSWGDIGCGTITSAVDAVEVVGRLDRPGFLRCDVTAPTHAAAPLKGAAAAAVAPLEIQPSLPAPDDFDAYWTAQRARLAAEPLRPELTPVTSPTPRMVCFDVALACPGSTNPVRGYLARPVGAAPRSLPIILLPHAAGVRSSSLAAALHSAAFGAIAFDFNAHGILNGQTNSYYAELAQGALADYRTRDSADREAIYFHSMFLRLLRAIDFLKAQPEWDGRTFVVWGSSQGAGQAIVAAGLEPAVSLIVANVPALCDHTGNLADRISGWPHFLGSKGAAQCDPQIVQAVRYYDAVQFAARARAQAVFSAGFIDATTPPTSIYAMFNAYAGPKRIIDMPDMGHESRPSIQSEFTRVIRAHLAATAPPDARESPWRLRLDNRNDGPGIVLNGNRLSFGSAFVCVATNWQTQYFWLAKLPYTLTQTDRMVIVATDPKRPTPFHLDSLRLEALHPTRLRISVDGYLNEELPAMVEYVPLALPAKLLAGASVTLDDGDPFLVPLAGTPPLPERPPSRRIAVRGPGGAFVVTVDSGAGLSLVDRRAQPYKGRESFLLMPHTAAPPHLARGERFTHTLTLEVTGGFEPLERRLPAMAPSGGTISALPAVRYQPPPRDPLLLPKPREVRFDAGVVTPPTTLTLDAADPLLTAHFGRLLSERLADAGRPLPVRAAETGTPAWISVRMLAAPPPDRPDYYELAVTPTGVVIAAAAPRAAAYALGTLAQLIDGAGALRLATVRDWADFGYRGVHLLADQDALALHTQLIRHVFAPLRINQLVLECQYAQWPSHPELHERWSMPLADIAALRSFAAEHFITVTPLLQTWGHMEYLFRDGANLDLVEDPVTPYAYDVSNPRTYRVMSELLGDVRRAFPDAAWLHIGHDEVSNRGVYPARPANQGRALLDLLAQDLDFYRDFAVRERLTTMMWHDMLAATPARRAAFAAAPRKPDTNIVMVVWDYAPRTAFPEMDFLQQAGYRVIGATGEEDVENIVRFSRYAVGRQALGMMHTTWTGHNGNRVALFRHPKKIWPYVQAGCSFWNAATPVIDPQRPSGATRAFERLVAGCYRARLIMAGGERLTPLDLAPRANCVLEETGGFVGGTLTTPAGMTFCLASNGLNAAAVRLVGGEGVALAPAGVAASGISLLLAGLDSEAPPLSELGVLTVATTSGMLRQPIALGRETGNLLQRVFIPGEGDTGEFLKAGDPSTAWPVARPIFSPHGRYVLWQVDLRLPGGAVTNLTLRAHPGRALLLAGATLVE